MLKHWISECHTLKSLELGFRQVLPLSEVIAEAGAVFEQGLSKQSKVVLRSGRVQHGSTAFCSLIIAAVVVTECHWITMHWRCWCGKWSQWSNETLRFHNLAHRICFLPVLIAGPSWASRGRGSGFEQCLVTKASGSKLDFFSCFFLALARDVEQSNCQTGNLSCTLWYGFISSSDPPNSSHLVTPLHLALTILPPSSTLPFASPFSLLAPMTFYAFSAPTSFFLSFCLPTLKDSSLDLSPWYFAHNSCPSSTSSSSWT